MRVRVEYSTEVDDDYRRAIRHHYGETGLATRAEVKAWLENYGTSLDDDIMYQLGQLDAPDDDEDDDTDD